MKIMLDIKKLVDNLAFVVIIDNHYGSGDIFICFGPFFFNKLFSYKVADCF